MKGLILGGRYGELIARQRSEEAFEMGELLIAEDGDKMVLVQVFDLLFGSQVSLQNRELIGGMRLEEGTEFEYLDKHLREYTIAHVKELISIKGGKPSLAKSLPGFFSELRDITEKDFSFLTRPKNPLFFGNVRSGSKELPVSIHLDGKEVLSHHVLIPATTGRGKSNLLKCLLWSTINESYCGLLVLDPHDEYYRPKTSLSLHPARDKIHYYSPNPMPGTNTLLINHNLLKPQHFDGVSEWSTPQKELLNAYYKEFGKEWVSAVMDEKELPFTFNEATLAVVKRRITQLLRTGFTPHGGETTVGDVVQHLEQSHTVVIDTSSFAGPTEILLGSIFSEAILNRYKRYKTQGLLAQKPVISIVLEEAPRVLGKEVLERGSNIFSTIAREGRKFQVGLLAITQLPSLIPRQILANMNTKIILGIEMKPERQAIIDSAAQDLSSDERAIASLDKGEAIITSNFATFAIPIKVPFFDTFIAAQKKESVPTAYPGLKS